MMYLMYIVSKIVFKTSERGKLVKYHLKELVYANNVSSQLLFTLKYVCIDMLLLWKRYDFIINTDNSYYAYLEILFLPNNFFF